MTIFTAAGLVHQHSKDCSHSLTSKPVVATSIVFRHRWRRIDYEDDVVPWHCMNCDETDNSNQWDGHCPNAFE